MMNEFILDSENDYAIGKSFFMEADIIKSKIIDQQVVDYKT